MSEWVRQKEWEKESEWVSEWEKEIVKAFVCRKQNKNASLWLKISPAGGDTELFYNFRDFSRFSGIFPGFRGFQRFIRLFGEFWLFYPKFSRISPSSFVTAIRTNCGLSRILGISMERKNERQGKKERERERGKGKKRRERKWKKTWDFWMQDWLRPQVNSKEWFDT